jgi:hypothetical protein
MLSAVVVKLDKQQTIAVSTECSYQYKGSYLFFGFMNFYTKHLRVQLQLVHHTEYNKRRHLCYFEEGRYGTQVHLLKTALPLNMSLSSTHLLILTQEAIQSGTGQWHKKASNKT